MPSKRTSPVAIAFLSISIASPSAFAQWEGLPAISQCDRGVFDASIAVGTSHVVHTANSQLLVTLKGGAFVWTRKLDYEWNGSIWTPGFFGLNATRIVDPRVLYNQYTARFTISGIQWDGWPSPPGQKGVYLAYSPSADVSQPTNWNVNRTPAPVRVNGVDYDVDFSGLGISQSHTVYTCILGPLGFNGPAFGHLYRFVPTARLSGALLPTDVVDIVMPDNPTNGDNRGPLEHAAPAHSFGGAPYLHLAGVATTGSGSSRIRIGVIRPNQTPLLSEYLASVPDFVLPPRAAPQPPRPLLPRFDLEADDGRIQNAVYRDGHLYACHTVVSNAAIAIRWYQFRMNGFPDAVGQVPNLVQWGDVTAGSLPGADARPFYPAIGVDDFGGIGLVFGASSSAIGPGLYAYGRAFSLGMGQMTGPTALVTGGQYHDQPTAGTNLARWGDYSGIALDPANPYVFYGSGGKALGTPSGGGNCFSFGGTTHWRTEFNSFQVTPNVVDPYAATFGLGTWGSCGNANARLSTMRRLPTIGTTIWLDVTNPTCSAMVGVFMQSLGTAPGTPFQNAFIWLDPLTAVQLPGTFAIPAGQWTSRPVPIPFNQYLIGYNFYFEAFLVDPSSTLSSTNGLRLTFGL